MHPALILLLVAAGAFAVALFLVGLDLVLYLRTRAVEARRFAHRRHVQPNHFYPDALGDPMDCWDPTHNHNPQDFDGRFRSRNDSLVRIAVALVLVVVMAFALLAAAGLGLASLVIG